MCHRFHCLTYDEVLDVIHDIEASAPLNIHPDWPAVPRNAYPQSRVPLIISALDTGNSSLLANGITPTAGALEASELIWGFTTPWNHGISFNTRIESNEKPFWRDAFIHRRCLIPCFQFYEFHQTEKSKSPETGKPIKRPYEFSLNSDELIIIAGLWQEDRFSMVTTEPNATVAPIHNRMPLVLESEEIPTWLFGDYPSLADRSSLPLSAEPILPLASGKPDQLALGL